jgi:hypothetical protein
MDGKARELEALVRRFVKVTAYVDQRNEGLRDARLEAARLLPDLIGRQPKTTS